MKAFSFRLEQVLRWRETQVNLQKSRTATASARLAGIEASLEAGRAALAGAAARMTDDPTGASLASWAGFRRKSQSRIAALESQAAAAKLALSTEMVRLVEANRAVRLIENLRHSAQDRWRAEFDRELAAFADEAALRRSAPGRLQSESRRARSSGG